MIDSWWFGAFVKALFIVCGGVIIFVGIGMGIAFEMEARKCK